MGKEAWVLTHYHSLLLPFPPWDRGLHLEHVCLEPGPLSALPRLQAERALGTATLGPLHIKGGREESQAWPWPTSLPGLPWPPVGEARYVCLLIPAFLEVG